MGMPIISRGSPKWWHPKNSAQEVVPAPEWDSVMHPHNTNSVAVFIPVDDINWHALPINMADIDRQRDIQPHVVILDRTEGGLGPIDGATVVEVGDEESLGEAYRAGLKHTKADLIALNIPGVRCLPNRLTRQRTDLAINRHIDLVTSNMVLVDEHGCLTAEVDPNKADEAPTPYWQAGVMIRRTALNRIGCSDDLPVELFLYMRLRAQGRTGHMDAVLTVANAGEFFALIEDSLQDALAIRNINPPIRPSPDKFANARRAFDARLSPDISASDALDRMIREGTFDR
jgi:hypothetical protein